MGNAYTRVVKIRVPEDETIYVGSAGSQHDLLDKLGRFNHYPEDPHTGLTDFSAPRDPSGRIGTLDGGGDQVYIDVDTKPIPEEWLILNMLNYGRGM